MNERTKDILAQLAAGAFVIAAGLAFGKAYGATDDASVHAVVHTVSMHNKGGRNNYNWGVGLMGRVDDTLIAAGHYRNSHYRTSQYVIAGWQPLTVGNFRAGAGLGVVRGYPAIRGGRWSPAAALLLNYQVDRLGVNVLAAPPANADSAGVVHLYLSWRL